MALGFRSRFGVELHGRRGLTALGDGPHPFGCVRLGRRLDGGVRRGRAICTGN